MRLVLSKKAQTQRFGSRPKPTIRLLENSFSTASRFSGKRSCALAAKFLGLVEADLPWLIFAVRLTLIIFALLLSASLFAQENRDEFPVHQHSRYFDFHAKRNPERVAAIAHFADAFLDIVNRDFFKADFDYPIHALVLEDRPTFQDYLRRRFRVADPPNFGIYLSQYKLFVTYEDSGLGTFTHEIMHPLVERNLSDRPLWALEGIPTFFEKFYGYWTNDQLVVHWGFQNPWRIEMLGTNLTHLNLERILALKRSPGDFRESDLRMVSMFLWEQGKFKRFLELIQRKDKAGFDSYFEAAMGAPVQQVLPLWQDYLNRVQVQRQQIMQLPASFVSRDEQDYDSFASHFGSKPAP